MGSLLESTLAQIEPRSEEWRRKARERLEKLTMPHWALGRVMDLAEDLAGMTRSMKPPVARRAIIVQAADHGVAAEGVSRYPPEVTRQMVFNFVRGGAGINALAGQAEARVIVADLGVAGDLTSLAESGAIISKRVASGTANIARGPAMTSEQAIRSVEAGIELVADLDGEIDLFATGDMGIGNTTPSSAITAVLCGRSAEEVTGCGTGIGLDQRRHKIRVVERALRINQPDAEAPMDVLAKVGGFEIGGIAGVILGAAARRKPVLVDGFISTAGALLAAKLHPASPHYMIGSHRSAEPGHRYALETLGLCPLLDLGLRLGEGTGAALAMHLVEAAVRVLTQVATFDEAGVSRAIP